MSNLIFQQQGSSPSDAGSGYSQIYAKSDGKVYRQAGTDSEVEISSLVMSDITSASSLSGSKVCAKAWVIFTGTGTVAIRAGYNVASVTDVGTGSYTVNFTTDMGDNDFACMATADNIDCSAMTHSHAVGSIGCYQFLSDTNTYVDAGHYSIVVFGN